MKDPISKVGIDICNFRRRSRRWRIDCAFPLNNFKLNCMLPAICFGKPGNTARR